MVHSKALAAIGLAPLALALAAGCGEGPGEAAHAGDYLGTGTEALSVKCGANKYRGLQGVDVSEWQQNFDWKSARHRGIAFGFARVSYGAGHLDPYFHSNWKNMKANGIIRGAYQYFLPDQSATAQAHIMVNAVGRLGSKDLPCALDVEVTDGQSASTMRSKIRTWVSIVRKGTGKTPIIYTGGPFWEDFVNSTGFSSNPLWIADYDPSCPSLPRGWGKWKMWQYCDGRPIHCSNAAGYDRDVFNGSKEDLLRYAANGGTLKAKGVRKWSNAERFHGKAADYLVCAGHKLKMSITFKNIGTAVWRDVKGRGNSVGSDVFLVTASGKKDRFTHHAHYSIRLNKNRHVRGDRNAPNCSAKNGCRKTTFIEGAMSGRAPNKPGFYKSRWRLRDFSKAWGNQSHGFGPKVQLKFKVVNCNLPTGACGCKVTCDNGQTHRLSSSITSKAQCSSAGEQYCRQHNAKASVSITTFKACPVPPSSPVPPSGGSGGGTASGSSGSGGGTASGSGSSASGSGGGTASGSGGSASGSGGAVPFSGNAGASGGQGLAGAGGAPSFDPGSENDPNGISINQKGDNSKVQDDPGYSDNGFHGNDQAANMVPNSGCSVAAAGEEHGAPLGFGALMLLFGVVEIRRRARRRGEVES